MNDTLQKLMRLADTYAANPFKEGSGSAEAYEEISRQALEDELAKALNQADAKHLQPLYTEAQILEKHKRILWDVCKAYGKTGECIFLTFKHKAKNQ